MSALTQSPTTRRQVFTLDELMALQDHGAFGDNRRVALHEGNIVEAAADGFRHIGLTMALAERAFFSLAGKGYFVGVPTTLQFARTNAPMPDLYVLSGGAPDANVPVERVLLVIDVADSSLAEDLGDSADRFARAGVEEFWVVDAVAREILVHKHPHEGRYADLRRVASSEGVTPVRVLELQVVLDQVWPAK